MNKNSTKIYLEQMKYVNFEAINVPSKDIHWITPYINPNWSFQEKNVFGDLSNLSRSEWKRRLSRGKFVDIEDLNYEKIQGHLLDIRKGDPWRLIRVAATIDSKYITSPIVYKNKDGYNILDGRHTAIIFHHFKKSFKIWLIDDTIDSDDYTRVLDTQVENEIQAEKAASGHVNKKFDYNQIDDSHKALIRDVVERLEKEKNYSLAQELKILCKLQENKKFDIEKSLFFNLAKDFPLSLSKQGFVTVSENGEITEYPIISTCGDIREYEKFIEHIIKTYGNIK
jgi:hypothetical protein